eukprot:m.343982 g.343982  ORF g.343982 m.343982 type:complete len:53 (+) comp20639_c0_seq7:121-279(+)
MNCTKHVPRAITGADTRMMSNPVQKCIPVNIGMLNVANKSVISHVDLTMWSK